MCSIAFDRKKGDVNVWRHVKTCEDMRWRVKVVNANNFHWSLLHMNEEPDPGLTYLWSHYGHFGYPSHIFLLLGDFLMRWDGFKYFWLACRSQIRQRISLSGNRKKGADGEISSDLYRLSWADIWTLNFFRLQLHQFWLDILLEHAQWWFLGIVVELPSLLFTR